MDQKVFLNMVKRDQLCAIALKKPKLNFESFTQNGRYRKPATDILGSVLQY